MYPQANWWLGTSGDNLEAQRDNREPTKLSARRNKEHRRLKSHGMSGSAHTVRRSKQRKRPIETESGHY
jgi:hypothetical protein